MSRSSKHQQAVMEKAALLGYEELDGGKHLKFRHPKTGCLVFTSKSPSDRYGTKNAIRDLERYAKRQ